MELRRATLADVPDIVRLLHQLSLPGEQREIQPDASLYRAQFDAVERSGAHLWVAIQQGHVVGTAIMHILHRISFTAASVAMLENVVVDAGSRSQGVGEALVAHAVADARAAGCQRMELTSRQERHDAHRFWQRCGFTPSHLGFKRSLT